jgi:hypothetical protein
VATRRSIYSNPELEAILSERTSEDRGVSGIITTICARYDELVRRELATLGLNVNEWCLVCDVLNGWMGDEPRHIAYVRHEVADGIQMSGLDKKWKVDGEALLQKFAAFSYSQLVAITDTAERFWLAEQGHDEDLAAVFEKLGVRIKHGQSEPS